MCVCVVRVCVCVCCACVCVCVCVSRLDVLLLDPSLQYVREKSWGSGDWERGYSLDYGKLASILNKVRPLIA